MNTELPAILQNYYEAKNRHDVDAMAECFGDDARVHDEGEDIVGRAAIREWIARTTEAYRVQVEVTKAEVSGSKVAVTAMVSGNFDGSPLEMYYAFTLENGKIVGLGIDA